MEFEGDFETHITVRVEDHPEVEAVRSWAVREGLKFHHIILDRGLTPSQPMVSRRARGKFSTELAHSAEIHRRLTLAGFFVSRIKIEAAPGNDDIPTSDAQAIADHAGRYFEHHVKLAIEPETNLEGLAKLAEDHEAHLSRNARRVRDDGRQERFVTRRCYNVGQPAARNRLKALLTALEAAAHAILSVEEEFVVHDSNPEVDAGWLELRRV